MVGTSFPFLVARFIANSQEKGEYCNKNSFDRYFEEILSTDQDAGPFKYTSLHHSCTKYRLMISRPCSYSEELIAIKDYFILIKENPNISTCQIRYCSLNITNLYAIWKMALVLARTRFQLSSSFSCSRRHPPTFDQSLHPKRSNCPSHPNLQGRLHHLTPRSPLKAVKGL